jgi:hypothetical protein
MCWDKLYSFSIYIDLINSSVLHVRYMNIKHVRVARTFY